MSKAKSIVHSVSAVKLFEQCRYKYQQLRITKRYKDTFGEAAAFGDAQHNLAETALKQDTPLAAEMGLALEFVRGFTGLKMAEAELGLTRELTPCGWWDDDVWYRLKIDTQILNGDHGICIDYKTGKRYVPFEERNNPRAKPDEYQLLMYALAMFIYFPQLSKVTCYLYWTHNGHKPDKYVYYREADAHKMQKAVRATPRMIEKNAQRKGDWKKDGVVNAKPLCGYCCVEDCEYWRKPKK